MTPRNSQFRPFLNALHESRRKQAARILSQYRDLIREPLRAEMPEAIRKHPTASNLWAGPVGDGRAKWRLIARSLTVLVVLGFGILHLFGASILHRGFVDPPATNDVVPTQGD
jgi:hypothetical protein